MINAVTPASGLKRSNGARICGGAFFVVSLASLVALTAVLQFSLAAALDEGARLLVLPVNISMGVIAAVNVARSWRMMTLGVWSPLPAILIYSAIALLMFGFLMVLTP